MTIQHVLLNIHNASTSVGKYTIVGGVGQQGKPVHVKAQPNVKYQLTDQATGFGPENIATKRVGKNLHIAFEGGNVDAPDLIIEDYYAEGALGYNQGAGNLLTGQAENGLYYSYVPESAQATDAVSLLADGFKAGQVLGGESFVAPLWHPLTPAVTGIGMGPLAGILGSVLVGAAAGGGGGSGGGSGEGGGGTPPKDTTPPAKPDVVAKSDGSVTVAPPADPDATKVTIIYQDESGKPITIEVSKTNGTWMLPANTPDGITIAPDGTVFLPEANVKDGGEVKAIATDANNNTSLPGTGIAVDVNDAPVISLTPPKQFTEDKVTEGSFVSLATAKDGDGDTVTYAITAGSDPDGLYAIDGTTGVVTLTQAGVDWVNAGKDLPVLSVTGTDNNPLGALSGTATTTPAATVDVNDAPINTVPAAQTVAEDGNLVIAGLTVADEDAGTGTMTTTLEVFHGTLTVVGGAGVVSGSGTSKVTLTGTLDQINAVLEAANAVTYAPSANYNGTDKLLMTTSDGGYTGDGGVKTDIDSFDITVTPVNDAPSGADKIITIFEDGNATAGNLTTPGYTLTVGDFGFSDPLDNPANLLSSVKISSLASAGTLYLGTVAVTSGQVISKADIDAGKLTFVPAANASDTGYSSFTFQVIDDGATGGAHVNMDQSANTITFNVTAVNDAPTGADQSITIFEDGNKISGNLAPSVAGYTFVPGDFTTGFADAADPTANSFKGIKLTSLPNTTTQGDLYYNGLKLTTADSTTVYDVTKLKFVPLANYSGTATFDFKVVDDGGTVNGGVDTAATANTMTIEITPVNDAPVWANPAVLPVTEFGTVLLNNGLYSFTDVDALGADVMTLTITSDNGADKIKVVSAATSGLTISNTADNAVVIEGSKAALQQLLASTGNTTTVGNGYIQLVNNANFGETFPEGLTTKLTFTLNDHGATGVDPGVSGTATTEEGGMVVKVNQSVTNDVITGGSNPMIYGGGDDVLVGAGGADKIYGGAGNDVLYGDSGYVKNWSFENWYMTGNNVARNGITASPELQMGDSLNSTAKANDYVEGWRAVSSGSTFATGVVHNSMQLLDGDTNKDTGAVDPIDPVLAVSGAYYVDSGRGTSTGSSQTGFGQDGLNTAVGDSYTLSFRYTTETVGGVNPGNFSGNTSYHSTDVFKIYWNGTTIVSADGSGVAMTSTVPGVTISTVSDGTSSSWATATITIPTSLVTGTDQLFFNTYGYVGTNTGIDNVRLQATNGGNDEIHGGSGNDKIFGMQGDDTLYGDAGNDVFFYSRSIHNGNDTIKDFSAGDRIVIGDLLNVNKTGDAITVDPTTKVLTSTTLSNVTSDVQLKSPGNPTAADSDFGALSGQTVAFSVSATGTTLTFGSTGASDLRGSVILEGVTSYTSIQDMINKGALEFTTKSIALI